MMNMETSKMDKEIRIGHLMTDILYHNRLYRLGTPKISDDEYDELVKELETLDSGNQVLIDKDYTPIEGAEQIDLPTDIASLTKTARTKEATAYENLMMWIDKYNLHDVDFCCSGKYDGVMFLVDEESTGHKPAYKKGEDNCGYSVSHHYKKISTHASSYKVFTVGEVLFSRKTFDAHFSKSLGTGKYENGRNTIAGKTNPLSDASDDLYHADFMRYTLIDKVVGEYCFDKSTQLLLLNKDFNKIPVPYEVMKLSEMTEAKLDELFKLWSVDYEIDGIVIDVNDQVIREKLGRETGSNNPAYARAYKGDFEDREDTKCTKLTWEITKFGKLAPRCWFDPIRLNGATVQKCYVDNAKFVVDSGVHVGAEIEVKRSGMIIPRLSKVYTAFDPYGDLGKLSQSMADFDNRFKVAQEFGIVPSGCPICSGAVELTENDKGEKVDLMCINPYCSGKALRRMVAFFRIMGAKGIGDSTLEMLYDMGYDTIEKVLEIPLSKFESFDGYGKSKAAITFNALHDCLKNVSIVTVMHASGYFPKMGSDKLGIIEDYSGGRVEPHAPSVSELTDLSGIAEKSAKTYVDNFPKFRDFMVNMEKYVTYKHMDETAESINTDGKCAGWVVVFTRWRDKKIEEIIEQEGGIVKKGYSKAITHVFPAEKGHMTSKERKASDDGKIIWDQHELKKYLGYDGYAKKDDKEKDDFETGLNW